VLRSTTLIVVETSASGTATIFFTKQLCPMEALYRKLDYVSNILQMSSDFFVSRKTL
jgi:hypothetical protein